MFRRSLLLGLFFACVVVVAGADGPPARKRRVPAPKDAADVAALPAATVKRLDAVEAALADPKSDLRQLHAEAVKAFIRTPGFGMGRMGFATFPFVTKETWSTDDLEREPAVKPADVEPLHLMNVLGLTLGFPPRADRGPLFKDDRPHPVYKLRAPAKFYVRQMNLVGLLTHDEPTVYRTPDYFEQAAREPTTRPIDPFEAAGLDRLRAGDDLFVRQRARDEIRLLGAIRATDGCLKCHDGRRGDLLGAFSYSLVQAAR